LLSSARLRHTRLTKSDLLFARYDASALGRAADRPTPRAIPTTKVKPSRIWYQALALLIGIGVTAGLLGAAAALDLQEYRVTRPGEVLFRHAVRRAELATLPESEVQALCGAQRQQWPTHGISRNVYNGQQPGETFAWTMMTGAAAAFALDDIAARRAVISNLTRWANGDALGQFKKVPAASMYYNLDRTLFPTIVAFSLVRDHPDFGAADRGLVAAWLDRLVERRGPGRPKDPALMSSQNNHGYLGDSVTMAWGIVGGEDALFRTGVARFVGALDQMRADGSLPLETARGARALHYQRHAIGSARGHRGDGRDPGIRPLSARIREPRLAAPRHRFSARRDRKSSAGSALSARQREPGPVPEPPGPRLRLPGATRPWPPLHGVD
jgi:hypothetical protein